MKVYMVENKDGETLDNTLNDWTAGTLRRAIFQLKERADEISQILYGSNVVEINIEPKIGIGLWECPICRQFNPKNRKECDSCGNKF